MSSRRRRHLIEDKWPASRRRTHLLISSPPSSIPPFPVNAGEMSVLLWRMGSLSALYYRVTGPGFRELTEAQGLDFAPPCYDNELSHFAVCTCIQHVRGVWGLGRRRRRRRHRRQGEHVPCHGCLSSLSGLPRDPLVRPFIRPRPSVHPSRKVQLRRM